ncbi:MAG: nucleoside monophosphate kinase [candidate division KSB1 bacterium]|nr:nucleoside monophosphate kinase [candidate division KSB1 bacterium]MDZ7274883.1 nucleoside monophosphate kinase [candidate division KSB1 bacterium]MDZ7286665.1 nucleoside monophosphate kinase [candidate division KSB1 bacterium]MDZ7299172.1 nucleoside monophosphate kinase [candidate division KSB1 bacterium]MDZ7307018.1 nucleoside monophosphate kinase [candidate division KSB1 bacterium]
MKISLLYNTVLLFGPPGSGKGTWGKILGMMPGFYHLSTGEMFRRMDIESELGQRVMAYMRQGDLVPDQIVFNLWTQHMQNAALIGTFKPQKDILVLDGFPRTQSQAETLKTVAHIKAIVLLHCADPEILVARLHRRAVQENRTDDASEPIIRRRLVVFEREMNRTLAVFPNDLIDSVEVSQPPVRILAALGAILARRLAPEES